MIKFLTSLDKFINKIYEYIMVTTGTAVVLLIMVNAFMRYFLKKDFFGSEELTLFIAFWLYFIGSASAAREKTHINASMLSLFTKNEKYLRIFEFIKIILSLIIGSIITYWCYTYVSWSFQLGAKSNIFKIPNVIAQFPILLSFVLWLFYLIRDLIVLFTQKEA